MERVETQLYFVVFRPQKLHIPDSRLGSTKGQQFEFGLKNILVQEMGSSARKGSKNPMT
jgi:hypothetical protein